MKKGKTLMEVFADENKEHKMYKYCIGFSMFDGGSSVNLLHEQKFSHEEITEMVAEALAEIAKQLIEKEPKLFNYMFKIYSLWETYGERMSVADYLIAEKGFVIDKFDIVWCIEGSDSVIDKTDDSIELQTIRKHLEMKEIDTEKLEID
jgi:hypothetical protein